MERYPGMPIWQLPITSDGSGSGAYIQDRVKYHCFVNNVTLCKRYNQDTDFYETTIQSGEILRNPDIACKICRRLWLKKYVHP